MAIIFDGQQINRIIEDGVEYTDGIKLGGYSYKTGINKQIFTSDGTFTVPPDVTSIKLLMIGGGGSGSMNNDTGADAGGGRSGVVIDAFVAVSPLETAQVIIGIGGGRKTAKGNGVGGTSTDFISIAGTTIASGGGGGNDVSGGYLGNNGVRIVPFGLGSYNHGTQINLQHWGGQAGFGDGGDTAYFADAQNGQGYGSGGGSVFSNTGSNGRSGAGANGYCEISW